jgi:hypothetical protein
VKIQCRHGTVWGKGVHKAGGQGTKMTGAPSAQGMSHAGGIGKRQGEQKDEERLRGMMMAKENGQGRWRTPIHSIVDACN